MNPFRRPFSAPGQRAAPALILSNATSIVLSTGSNLALGFLFWLIATREFDANEVGFAAAAIAAMQPIGTAGMLGQGTSLIGVLARGEGEAGSLIATGLLTCGLVAGALGAGVGVLLGRLLPGFEPLATGQWRLVLFSAGVSLTAMGLVLDEALVGLLRGDLQFARNFIFSLAKLAAVFLLGARLHDLGGFSIYAAWAGGIAASLAAIGGVGVATGKVNSSCTPRIQHVKSLSLDGIKHHALNLVNKAPTIALPVVVTVVISATANAYFYTAAMVASLGAMAPSALSTMLYAIVARSPAALTRRLRFSLSLSFFAGTAAVLGLIMAAPLILSFFGTNYAQHATGELRILALSTFPLAIKSHYVAISRVRGQMTRAARLAGAYALAEVGFAAFGGYFAGLPGASIGWVIALLLEASAMTPTVYRAAQGAAEQRPATVSAAHRLVSGPSNALHDAWLELRGSALSHE